MKPRRIKKLKHLKLFEDFTTQSVSKSPLTIPTSLNEISLAEKMMDKLGLRYFDIEILGHGANGTAYDIGFDKVFKITSSYQEWKEAKQLIGKDLKHIVKIYQVDEENTNGHFGIIKEKVDMVSKQIKDILFICEDSFYPGREDIWEKGIYNETTSKWLETLFMNHNTSNMANNIFKQIAEMVSECLSNNIIYDDLRHENVGLRGTDLVFFDIGVVE